LAGLVASLALLVYTDAWGFVVWLAFGLAVLVVWWRSNDRRGIARDALIAFGAAAILFLPWLPTLVHQAASATDPWHYAPHLGANPLRDFFGSDRISALFGLAIVAGVAPLLTGPERRGALATGVWVTTTVWVGAILLALFGTPFVASLTGRYLAPLIAPVLLLCAIGCARSGIFGLVLLIFSCMLLSNPASFIGSYKSDMYDVANQLAPYVREGDTVLVDQPEQAPLAAYYFGRGLHYATALGPDSHPSYIDWDNAQTHLQQSSPQAVVNRVVAGLKPGQRLVVIRPLTEGVLNWSQPWSQLVRLRAAQIGALLKTDPRLRQLPGVAAPGYYRGAADGASSALVFVKR
jgi:hypothetical protein